MDDFFTDEFLNLSPDFDYTGFAIPKEYHLDSHGSNPFRFQRDARSASGVRLAVLVAWRHGSSGHILRASRTRGQGKPIFSQAECSTNANRLPFKDLNILWAASSLITDILPVR